MYIYTHIHTQLTNVFLENKPRKNGKFEVDIEEETLTNGNVERNDVSQ